MKLITIILITVAFFSLSYAYERSFNDDRMLEEPYNYCYACYERDMYVRVRGTDSKEMREKAITTFGCKPFIMVSKCDTLTTKDRTTLVYGVLK